jgi:predicted alpha/beta hydrolase family esterase
MKTQVVLLHGGSSYKSHEDYLKDLINSSVSLDRMRARRDWKEVLAKSLANEAEVFIPRLPNANNAQYDEWKIWFDKIASVLSDEVILVGHSLGGIFLAKYLSENVFPKKIIATFLLAAPFENFDNPDELESLEQFKLPASLSLLQEQGGAVYLLHSKDDPVVPYDEVLKYKNALPQATLISYDDKHHFIAEEFKEME